jgi:glutaconyl-CoA/methylmalonyl-CoA decarboxylase subunit delta
MNLLFILIQTNLNTSHPSADEMVKHDPYGVFLAIMSIGLVMVVLTLIYLAFKAITKLIHSGSRMVKKNGEPYEVSPQENMPSGEISAAIAYALQLYMQQLNSEEATELTIKRIAHRYSPWSSKIHTLQRNPGQYN